MKHRKTLRIVGAACVAAIVALLVWHEPLEQAARDLLSEGNSSGAIEASFAHGRRAPAEGPARATLAGRYDVDYAMHLIAPTADGPQKGEMGLKGTLEVADGPSAGWLVGRFVGPVVTADAQLAPMMGVAADKPGAGFDAPFAARLDEDGAVMEIRHGRDAPLGARNIIKGLLMATQVVRSEQDAGTKEWTVVEPGTDDDIEAEYRLSHNVLTKTWESKQLGGERTAPMSAIGKVTMALHYHLMRTCDFALHVKADLGLGLGEAKYEGEVRAKLTWRGQKQADWAAGIALDELEKGLGKLTIRAPKPVIEVAKGTSADALIDAASAAAKAKKHRARRMAMQQLAVSIQRDPGLAKTLAERLRNPRPGDARRTIIEAMASSDTPAAKAEMARLMDDEEAEGSLRADVAVVSTFMPNLDDKMLASLRRQSQNAGHSRLGTAALFAMAGQSRLMAEKKAEYAALLAEELRQRAATKLAVVPVTQAGATAAAGVDAKGSSEAVAKAALVDKERPGMVAGADLPTLPGKDGEVAEVPVGKGGALPSKLSYQADWGEAVTWLDAVGTIGGPEAFSLVKPWLGHPNHQVRMTAVFALRFVHTSDARIELVNVMSLDKDGWVRRAAVMATRYHKMAPFIAPVKTALKDVHPNVRLAAAYNLAMWAHEAPTLMQAVRDAASREPKALVARAMWDLEPMLIRDTEDGVTTMEPVLPKGQHIKSVPSGVVLVERQAPKTANSGHGALTSDSGAEP